MLWIYSKFETQQYNTWIFLENSLKLEKCVCVCVPTPTHCTIMRFGFHTGWIDGIECGLFSNHAPLGQTTYVKDKIWSKRKLDFLPWRQFEASHCQEAKVIPPSPLTLQSRYSPCNYFYLEDLNVTWQECSLRITTQWSHMFRNGYTTNQNTFGKRE